jgi:hypothetical protein
MCTTTTKDFQYLWELPDETDDASDEDTENHNGDLHFQYFDDSDDTDYKEDEDNENEEKDNTKNNENPGNLGEIPTESLLDPSLQHILEQEERFFAELVSGKTLHKVNAFWNVSQRRSRMILPDYLKPKANVFAPISIPKEHLSKKRYTLIQNTQTPQRQRSRVVDRTSAPTILRSDTRLVVVISDPARGNEDASNDNGNNRNNVTTIKHLSENKESLSPRSPAGESPRSIQQTRSPEKKSPDFLSRNENGGSWLLKLKSAKVNPIFGMRLKDYVKLQPLKHPNSSNVPNLVIDLVELLLPHAGTEGIFRISGQVNQIDALVAAYDQNQAMELKIVHPEDIHVYASLLKRFFQSLYQPLLTYRLYSRFIATQGSNLLTLLAE